MATQYEQGPEAQAVEKGFALDELMRRDRSETARTMLNAGAHQIGQQSQQAFQNQQAQQAQGYALDRMIKGESLKEQSKRGRSVVPQPSRRS